MRAIPLLIILAVASATGSLLFAAEPAQKPAPAKTVSPQENADVSTSNAAAPVAGSKAAQEKDETEKSPEKSAEKSSEKSSEKPEPAKSEADKASAADKAASPQRFIPSEQVRADFDVSFPVDI